MLCLKINRCIEGLDHVIYQKYKIFFSLYFRHFNNFSLRSEVGIVKEKIFLYRVRGCKVLLLTYRTDKINC